MEKDFYNEDYLSSSSVSPPDKKSILKIKKSKVWTNENSLEFSSESPSEINKKLKLEREVKSFKNYVDNIEDFQESEKLPERIEGYYDYDYNILIIDEVIIKKFAQDKKNKLISLKKDLENENKKILERQTMIERRSSRKKIKEIEEEIEKYELNIDKNSYILKSKSLLNEYKKIGIISVSYTHLTLPTTPYV